MNNFDVTAFRRGYSAFLRPGRVLLTGHSHQAWPDAARAAQERYFDDAARFVDEKWELAVFPVLERVRRGILARLGLPPDDAVAFGKSTHELVFRLLSCFPLGQGTRVVSTTSEFHSLHRQLARLAEAGADVHLVDARAREGLAERLARALTPQTHLLALSAVLFEDSHVVAGLPGLLARARELGVPVLVDAYHAFNVVPLDLGPALDHVYVTAGGYKYAQFGEGLCFMRLPPAAAVRPLYTGWFADFDALGRERVATVGYGEGGARFHGATFDGSAAYRAEAALANFDAFHLDVPALRALSLRMTQRLLDRLRARGVLDRAPLQTPQEAQRRGGFISLRTPRAGEVELRLRQRGVWVDHRGDLLRLGPAPYLLDDELDAGVDALAEELDRV
ncbi:MAG: aminotransferase class V-fold PLP-dependent enzyme [Deltaproteobacteria bacterium]|nr:aminotransferase class V-fold PLP-dependent enzyme [Deltaproteobacteria bacterium]